jgi:hypothetical protein
MAPPHHHREFSPFEFQTGAFEHDYAKTMRSIYGGPGESSYLNHFQKKSHSHLHQDGSQFYFGAPNYGSFQPYPYGHDHKGERRNHRRHHQQPEPDSGDSNRHPRKNVRDRSPSVEPERPRTQAHDQELKDNEAARQELHEALKGYESLTHSPEMTKQGVADALAKDDLNQPGQPDKLKPDVRDNLRWIGENWSSLKDFTKDKSGETINLQSADQGFDQRRDSLTSQNPTRSRDTRSDLDVGPPKDDPYADDPYYKTHLRPDESFPSPDQIADPVAFMNKFLESTKDRARRLGTVGECGQGVREGANGTDPANIHLIGDPKNVGFYRNATELGQLLQNLGWTKIPLNELTEQQRQALPTSVIVRPWSFNPNGAGDIAVKEHHGKQYNDHSQTFDYGSSRYKGTYALLPSNHPYAMQYRDRTSDLARNS